MCDYQGCDNKPEFMDDADNFVCEECMEREVTEYGTSEYEDYESLKNIPKEIKGKN